MNHFQEEDSNRLTYIVTAELHGVRRAVTEFIQGSICVLMDLEPEVNETAKKSVTKSGKKILFKTELVMYRGDDVSQHHAQCVLI